MSQSHQGVFSSEVGPNGEPVTWKPLIPEHLKQLKEEQWNEEVNTRLRALQCISCDGVNPYVCECARRVWGLLKLLEEVKRENE